MNRAAPSLAQAVDGFVSRYHSHPTLVNDQQDWSVVIGLCAPDTAETVAVVVHQGRVTAVRPEPVAGSLITDATLMATADCRCAKVPMSPICSASSWSAGRSRTFSGSTTS
jgi:hypothetical protein